MKPRRDRSVSLERYEPAMLDRLEQRALLSGAPFPALAELVNPNNSVVRIDTNLGDIDVELFDVGINAQGQDPAPITTANFLGYIRRGDYDESFFHRLATVVPSGGAETPFVLQGGGFRFLDGSGLSPVPQQAQIVNEFSANRPNAERTLAMAKLPPPNQGGPPNGGPNSATNQFFINLRNNSGDPAFLDQQNGGFTVFARVANDRSWDVVMAIAALQRRNLNNILSGGAFSDVPVTAGTPANPTSITEANLVTVRDMEVIKPQNVQQFFTDITFYPEGFAGSTINEFLPIENPNDTPVTAQIIARSEVPQGDAAQGFSWFRDRVIATITIPALSRNGITISRFGAGGAPNPEDLVPQGVPYALEVQSTQALVANLSHFDFGTATGEAFTRSTSTTWVLGEAQKITGNNGVADFLVWENTTVSPATITIDFFFDNAAPVTITTTTDMLRRGGLNLNEIASIPNNTRFSIRLTSDQPLVAALTHFDNRNPSDPLGSTTVGLAGNGSRFGVIPLGNVGPGAADSVSVVNPGNTAAIVNFTLTFNDGVSQPLSFPAGLIVQPGRRGIFDLTNIPQLADGRRYTIRYDTLPAGTQVYAHWLHRQSFSGISNADDIANPVGVTAATVWRFAEGFMDPARAGIDVFETVSVFNPNALAFGATNTPASVTLRFVYGDNFVLTQPAVTVGAGGRLDVDVHTLQSVLNQGTTNGRFFYSIEVISDVPIVAQMRHFDLTLGGLQPSGGFATLGAPFGTIVRLDALGAD